MPGIKELVKLPDGSAFRLLKWERNLREVFWVVSPQNAVRIDGEGTHWHYHQALELTLFISGRGTRFVGDRIQGFEAGEIVLLGENLPHYWHTQGNSSGLSVQFFFPPAHPVWAFPESAALSTLCKAAARGIHYHGKPADDLIAKLRQMVGTEGLERLGLFMQLLAIAAQAPAETREVISTQTFSLSGESEHQNAMRAAMRFLLTHYREEIRLSQLLEVTHMSKPTFCRYFKKHSGKTLGKFLQQIRVEAACRELVETEKPIIEIALGCGFSQISFFNRVFQRAVGCTPSHYRHRQRGLAP
ncbi:MAG: AraC family transcriptional regulator [Verrucomicrobiota bacterium]